MQWLVLLPHSKKVLDSNLLGAGGFSAWSLPGLLCECWYCLGTLASCHCPQTGIWEIGELVTFKLATSVNGYFVCWLCHELAEIGSTPPQRLHDP